jgi:hypothetical protein
VFIYIKNLLYNETANSIADPETYNRSDNGKVDVHIDHTSLPGGPNTSFVAVAADAATYCIYIATSGIYLYRKIYGFRNYTLS